MGIPPVSAKPKTSSPYAGRSPWEDTPPGWTATAPRPVTAQDLADEEMGILQFAPDKRPIDWEDVFDRLVPEIQQVWQKRGHTLFGGSWFDRWQNGDRFYVLNQIRHMPVTHWQIMAEMFQVLRPRTKEDLLVHVGRAVARLIGPSMTLHRDPRGWFGIQSKNGFFSAISSLAHSRFQDLIQDHGWEPLLQILDDLHHISAVHRKLPSDTLFSFRENAWLDLGAVTRLLSQARVRGLSWRGLYLALLQTQMRRFDRAHEDGFTLGALLAKIGSYSPAELAKLPRAHEDWKVVASLWLDLPGGIAIPNKIRFGMDTSKLERSDMRLVAFTQACEAVYVDPKGKIHSEGHRIPLRPEVQGWGWGVQLYITEENYAELLPRSSSPPAHCPWAWFARWGNGEFLASGEPVHPTEIRKPVVWYEQANQNA